MEHGRGRLRFDGGLIDLEEREGIRHAKDAADDKDQRNQEAGAARCRRDW